MLLWFNAARDQGHGRTYQPHYNDRIFMTKPSNDDGLDQIGDWSVDKLEILKAYSEQYALILQSQTTTKGNAQFHFGYIDGFAGAGQHIHKNTGAIVAGSPAIALSLPTKFNEYHFVDLDAERVKRLEQLCQGHINAHVHQGDCNDVLLNKLLPKFRYKDYRRALCLLDPYGMHLDWRVLATAGDMKSIEIFLNFPVMDINRNAKRPKLEQIEPDHRLRMTKFWGDETWHTAMFAPSDQANFLGVLDGSGTSIQELEKNDNEAFVAAFQKRLKEIAGFKHVPKPVAMRNSNNAVVYYLFFASNNPTGDRIANHIFKKYR
jgi:three-Cys-motif partner protein